MIEFKQQNDDEQAAIDREQAAHERLQRAHDAVRRHLKVEVNGVRIGNGDGQPPLDVLDELDAANTEWHEAQANSQRIIDEIASGKRR